MLHGLWGFEGSASFSGREYGVPEMLVWDAQGFVCWSARVRASTIDLKRV
jgi:hypothetical protein